MTGSLYRGMVVHERRQPFRRRFAYRVFSLLLDLDSLEETAGRLRLFAYNRWGLLSFHDRDHGPRTGEPLRPWVDWALAKAGLPTGGRIRVLSFPRLFGYVFNPLTVYYCDDPAGRLQAMLYEVRNTFGEMHTYLLPVSPDRDTGRAIEQRCTKDFYVSPFLPIERAEYRFRITEPGDRLSVLIDLSVARSPTLLATLTGKRRPLTDGEVLRAVLAYPLMTLKVMGAIHWQALHLWRLGARFHKRPPPPPMQVSVFRAPVN